VEDGDSKTRCSETGGDAESVAANEGGSDACDEEAC
jgi:hypothetical protein